MKKLFLTLSFAVFSLWLFSQNENPYSQFGYEAPIMKETEVKQPSIELFTLINPDTLSEIDFLIVDVKNHRIDFYSNDNKLIKQDTLLNYQMARWLTTDPAQQYYSPYIGMGNNPVRQIDPDGAKDIIYSNDGSSSSVRYDNWFHNTFFGERSFIEGANGGKYRLSDQGIAVVTGQNGEFGGFMEDWMTTGNSAGYESLLRGAINNRGERNRIEYIFTESQDGGFLDTKQHLKTNMLYGALGKAYNSNEAGNFVWGAALDHFGFDVNIIKAMAHGGTMYLEMIARPNAQGVGWDVNGVMNRLSRFRFDDEIGPIGAGAVHHRGYYR